MPFYFIGEELTFPPVNYADEDGLLAVGGDLSRERLLLAYKSGIFPWYSENEPILWFSPDPRFVLFPGELKISKSMKKIIRDKTFDVTMNRSFPEVIRNCRRIKRKGQTGTWITPEMMNAYVDLHNEGYAHSVEVWQGGQLVGGLYGLIIGSMFFGESMFSLVSNASKAALIHLVTIRDFSLIDCQVYTDHLNTMGARLIPRKDYLKHLETAIKR